MCRTSAPSRREPYELETELAANEGGFFVPKKPKPPRIGSTAWIHERPDTIAVFNGGFDVDGTRLDIGAAAEPWTVITPAGEWHHFWTHTEALEWALQEANK